MGLQKPSWRTLSKKDKRIIKKAERQRKSFMDSLKDVPCADCGQHYSSEAMDFDHVPGRGGKLGTVSSRKSMRAIIEEARKCDVVCANCHRVRTARRRSDAVMVKRERGEWLDGIANAVEREREAFKANMVGQER